MVDTLCAVVMEAVWYKTQPLMRWRLWYKRALGAEAL